MFPNSFMKCFETNTKEVSIRKKNYRPMSLVKLHINSLNEIIASWIQQCIEIHHNQVIFTKNVNVRECINIVHHINKLKEKHDNLSR